MDYNALGLVAGIEIHQQLNTREKLFCRCPTLLRPFEEHDGEFSRYLRATESELGEIDRAAREEMKNFRRFLYYTYDSTCLVENDEEPPAPLNPEALATCLQIAKMFGMAPIPQVHTMRKLVIDGSNTSGFQRTALVAVNGTLPNGGTIETICIEEEAAQRVKDEVFSLDRLGIPLVEITTSPCMHTPEEVQEIAEYLGMVLRSTGKVKRGLGTIRQDINISISGGARVEIKGVQELDLIAEVVRREVERQERLLSIRDRLKERGASVSGTPVDVTEIFSHTGSGILKKASRIMAVTLAGFAGLVGDEILSENDADLGNDAGIQRISAEYLSIPAQAVHAFLNARAARIDQPDDGGAIFVCQVHHAADLGALLFTERSALYGKVLRIDEHRPPVDLSEPGNNTIPVILLIFRLYRAISRGDELTDLMKTIRIEQFIQPFACSEFPFFVLFGNSFFTASQ